MQHMAAESTQQLMKADKEGALSVLFFLEMFGVDSHMGNRQVFRKKFQGLFPAHCGAPNLSTCLPK